MNDAARFLHPCIECNGVHCEPTATCDYACGNEHGECISCGVHACVDCFDECAPCGEESSRRAYTRAASLMAVA